MKKIEDDNTSIVIEHNTNTYKNTRFQMINSPQIFTRVNAAKNSQQKKSIYNKFHLNNLLDSKRGPNVKKINAHRQTYRQIKQKIVKTLGNVSQSKQNLSLAEVMIWKQQVLTSFMNEYLQQIQKQCKEKADILLFIWNSVFNIIDWLFEVVGKLSKQEEKDYLSNLIDNHKSYQSIIDNLNAKIVKKQQQSARQQEFIKALVYNLRFKRKEIKKLTKNLKVCTFRLNEIKDFYLDLQVQHIELLSQERDISKQNAKNLIKRKQEINHQKRKQFKLKQSHKKIRFQIQNEILNENANQSQNVDKLNEDLQVTFQKYYEKNKSTRLKINYPSAQNIFQNALDDFNVRIQKVPETQSLIDFMSNTHFIDAETDMADFVLDTQDKYTEITFKDRLFEGMISQMAVQTQQFKVKTKQYEEKGIQANFLEMKNLAFSRVKVYDNSFLISDYRDKRYKNQRAFGLQLGKERSTAGSKDLNYQESRIKSNRLINYQNIHIDKSFRQIVNEVAVQTESISILQTYVIPVQVRNIKFQKQIEKYFDKLNNYVLRDKTKQQQNVVNQKHSILPKKVNFKHKSLLHSDSQNSIELDGMKTSSHSTNKLKKKLGNSVSLSKKKYRIEIHQSNNKNFKFYQDQVNDKSQNIQSIQEHKYEHMGSKQYQENVSIEGPSRSVSISKSESRLKKFWFMKPETPLVHQKKQKFLNDLNKGDQLLSKTSIYKKNDVYMQNKKILSELKKLSEEIEHMKGNFDLIQESAHDNMSALREQLKNMLNKKRNNRKLALSRHQSLSRIISFVYTYAYHLYLNHKKQLRNLIIPLFYYFKIGYGEIKKNDLYLRMLYFLSQAISHQSQYYIFQSFILFLGLNITGQRQLKVGHQTTCLYLKLLHKLSINFRLPLSVEQLYTTVQYFDQKCKQILVEQCLQQSIIEKIIGQVKLKLRSVNKYHMNEQQEENKEFEQTKLNVFKCSELIIEQIEKIKSSIENSYEGLLEYFKQQQGLNSKDFISYVLKNSYFTSLEYGNKIKYLQQIKVNMSETKFYNKLGKTFMQMRMPTFQKIYYIALAKYKIKEEFLYLSLNRRLNFMLYYLKKHKEEFKTQQIIIDKIVSLKDNSVLKQPTTKRVMALAYLRIVQNETSILLNNMLGGDLSVFI